MRAYAEILKHGGPSYTKILRHLASSEAQPPTGILVHCSAGKDRTGVIVAVILRILGTPVEDVCREYQLTEMGLGERRKFVMERLMSSGAFTGEDGMAAAERMTGAKADSMRVTLEMVDKKYGSCEGYVRDVCGLTDGDIEQLRRNLTVREVPGEVNAGGGGGGGVSSAAVSKEKAVL
jgi:protein tyrosine/serine phosphatase